MIKENQQDIEILPAKKFDWDVTINMIEEIYETIL